MPRCRGRSLPSHATDEVGVDLLLAEMPHADGIPFLTSLVLHWLVQHDVGGTPPWTGGIYQPELAGGSLCMILSLGRVLRYDLVYAPYLTGINGVNSSPPSHLFWAGCTICGTVSNLFSGHIHTYYHPIYSPFEGTLR